MPKNNKKSKKPNSGSRQVVSSSMRKGPARTAPSKKVVPSRMAPMRYSNASPITSSRLMSFSKGTVGSLAVSGVETFSTVNCTSVFTGKGFLINPSNIVLFPRLQGLALQFEEFYVKKLSISFRTACPTTRSGSISLMFEYDPEDPPPKSILELMANENSVTGSSGENLSVRFEPSAQRTRWFYTKTPDFGSQYKNLSPDSIRQSAPGRVVLVTSNAVSGDVGLIAGYLSVHYEFEFRTIRPPTEYMAMMSSPLETKSVAASSPASSYTPLPLYQDKAIGYTGWADDSVPYTIPVSTYVAPVNSVLLSVGRYAINALWDWATAPSSGSDDEEDKDSVIVGTPKGKNGIQGVSVDLKYMALEKPRPTLRSKRAKSGFDTNWRHIRQKMDGSFEGQEFGSDVWLPLSGDGIACPMSARYSETPLAAGDINLGTSYIDQSTGIATSLVFNALTGTGVQRLERILELDIVRPGYIVASYNLATARTLNAFDLSCVLINNVTTD